MNEETETEKQIIKEAKKQSKKNQQWQTCNELLGFITAADEQGVGGSGSSYKSNQGPGNHNQRRKKRTGYDNKAAKYSYGYDVDKEQQTQATMKFVLQNKKEDGGIFEIKFNDDTAIEQMSTEIDSFDQVGEYLENFYNSNEKVNWRDVVQVRYDLVNSKGISCPIYMESLEEMICPRITKCGHIYCWPCILSYLDYQTTRNWKKCPLCSDSIYARDLKNVIIQQSSSYKEGQKIIFDLMVRSRENNLVKNKYTEDQILKKYEEAVKLKEEGQKLSPE